MFVLRLHSSIPIVIQKLKTMHVKSVGGILLVSTRTYIGVYIGICQTSQFLLKEARPSRVFPTNNLKSSFCRATVNYRPRTYILHSFDITSSRKTSLVLPDLAAFASALYSNMFQLLSRTSRLFAFPAISTPLSDPLWPDSCRYLALAPSISLTPTSNGNFTIIWDSGASEVITSDPADFIGDTRLPLHLCVCVAYLPVCQLLVSA